MIYFKRIWNVVAMILALIVALCSLPLLIFEVTIVAFMYYIATGKCYMFHYVPVYLQLGTLVYNNLKMKNV